MNRYILDTGILVGYARGAGYAAFCHQTYDLSNSKHLVFTSIVSKGEILALAEKNAWGGKKRQLFAEKLSEFPSADIKTDQVVAAYAQIKASTEGTIPPSAPHFPPPQKPARKMGHNDMWIAATAIASKATIITTDTDFDHLDAAGILKRIFISQSATLP